MARQSFDELFVTTLGELYDAEAQLAVGLPVLMKASFGRELSSLIEEMHHETATQLLRLEALFQTIGHDGKAESCWSVAPLLVDAYDAMNGIDPLSRHCGVALPLLSVMHLQIVRYQAVIAWALRCSMEAIAEDLHGSLKAKVEFARCLSEHSMMADDAALDEEHAPGPTIN